MTGMAGEPTPRSSTSRQPAPRAPASRSSVPRQPVPRREVVTGESRRVRPLPRYRAQAEIEEQTALGDAYVRSLMRGQLRAGLTAFAVLALVAGTLPLAFAALLTRQWSGLCSASPPTRCSHSSPGGTYGERNATSATSPGS